MSTHRLTIALVLFALLALAAATSLANAAAPQPLSPADFDCAGVEEIPVAECQALVDLYQSTNGDQWQTRVGWLISYTPCSTPWRGVTCVDGHVAGLQLLDNNLVGTLPSTLGDLSEIQALALARNELSGAIPPQLGNLAKLQLLNLADNQLSGAIPASLGTMSSLTDLQLGNNQLTGAIPAELAALPAIQRLVFTANQLSGAIPPQLGDLATLRLLGLGANQLTGPLPPELAKLAELRVLIVAQNQLSGTIPTALAQLSNLEELWLSGNQFDGAIPPELGDLTALRRLALSRNHLSGAIPVELSKLADLQELLVDSNKLSGPIPEALCDLGFLYDFYVAYNALSTAPSCLVGLDPDWARTQTVPPTGLQATVSPTGTVTLTWTPILYTFDTGHYEISLAPEGGSYTVHGVTGDKTASAYAIEGLAEGVYTVRVRTFTAAHDVAPAFQPNDLWSDYTEPVSVTIGEPAPVMHKLHLPWIEVGYIGK